MEPTALTGLTPTGPTEPTPTAPTAKTEPTPPCADAPDALSELIGQGATADFLARSFGRDLWRARLEPAVAQSFFGWPQLNSAIAEHRLGSPRLRLERAAKDVSREALTPRRTRRGETLHDLDVAGMNQALRDGATLILDAAHELSPPLQRLCAGLAAQFVCAVQTNLYACWGTTQGFDIHWDDPDVFVLQVEGRKTWRLYGSTRPWPTRLDFHGDHPKPEEPLEELVLTPGDVLYLPRGYWHAAVGRGEPTLHLTIGLTRKTGADFVQWLAEHALSDAAFRADLPLELEDTALAARIGELMRKLGEAEPAELARSYRRRVESAQGQRPKLSFPHIGRPDEPLPPDTRLRLADGVARLSPSERPDFVVLSWRGVEFTLAEDLAPALRRLVERRFVTLAEMQALLPDREQALADDLMHELLGRGVLVAA
jgi:hypothetical protein